LQEFTRLREQVIRYEQLLVSNISLAVDHPYQHLVTLAKAVDGIVLLFESLPFCLIQLSGTHHAKKTTITTS